MTDNERFDWHLDALIAQVTAQINDCQRTLQIVKTVPRPTVEPCHDCGQDAVAVQASSCEPETGYVDAMALCGPCYAARTGEVDLTPLLDALAKEAE